VKKLASLLQKFYNSQGTESKHTEISDKKFKSLLLKINSYMKEDSNKQMNEMWKSIRDLDKRVSMDEKFSKNIEILGEKTYRNVGNAKLSK
jgi:hypothetical protein